MSDLLLILNYDAAGSRAIARALRAEHICCKIVTPDISAEDVTAQQPQGLILAGGVNGAVPGGIDPDLLTGAWPVLALGDAAAMLCRQLGGDALETALCGVVGAVTFEPSPLTEGLESCERMLRSVRRLRLPASARTLAHSHEETVGFMHHVLPIYGVQFSLESNDTDGIQLLLNFALTVCGCTRWWTFEGFMDRTVEEIRAAVGDGQSICALTGGLDSAVAAMLAHRALGGRLQCLFIDTGLMRENEADQFLAYFRDQAGLNIAPIPAQDRFLSALAGITDPGKKRHIIAAALQTTLDEAANSLGTFSAILRATTCTDLMEGKDALSRPGLRGDLPMLEPLRELFKDEVRQVGAHLGIPEAILQRPSFPGSGLALRILGEVTPARLQTLRAADQIFTAEIAGAGLGKRMRHYFAVLTPLPEGDTRSAVILRAVQAGETAQQAYAARLPYDLLERVTERILRERPEVVRVVYDLSPSTRTRGVEWQ